MLLVHEELEGGANKPFGLFDGCELPTANFKNNSKRFCIRIKGKRYNQQGGVEWESV